MCSANPIVPVLTTWLESCKRHGKISRNTVAVGIVVLDHLLSRCPLPKTDLISKGGEIVGSRGGLDGLLKKHGLPSQEFLKEVTTRQAHQDGQRLWEGLRGGSLIADLPELQRREHLKGAIALLVEEGKRWLARQHLKISCDRSFSPATWINMILTEARGRSGGKVEQHLVGAKLERRHERDGIKVDNQPGHAGDVQTGRPGDFCIGRTSYHVTAAPGSAVIDKCGRNIAAGLHPVLLVPRGDSTSKARHLAEERGIDQRMTIIAIEDFIALNIIEMSKGEQQAFIDTLKDIVDRYNRRLEEVETDMSLRIEIQ